MEEDLYSNGFPNPSYNSGCESFTYSRRGTDIVLYNHNVVYEFGDHCIWLANDGYWNMGLCENIGENPVYILKDRNAKCPTGPKWFSGSRNLDGRHSSFGIYKLCAETLRCGGFCGSNIGHQYGGGRNPTFNSASASLTYQVRDGRYYQKCCWKKFRGNWNCFDRGNRYRC